MNEDSPAEKAGIKAGDIVVDYDGERVRSARQFTRLVQETPEGRSVAIGIVRDGKKQTVNATPEAGRMMWNFGLGAGIREPTGHAGVPLARIAGLQFRLTTIECRAGSSTACPRNSGSRFPASRFPTSRGRLGVSVQSITPELAEYFGAKNGGALVSSVAKESAAAKAGIRAGDVIVSINGKAVSDAEDLIEELESINGEATIVVLRDKKEMTLKATIERPRPAAPRAGSRPGPVL